MKSLYDFVFDWVMDLIKTKLVSVFVQTVDQARHVFNVTMVAVFGIILGSIGFVFIHLALLLYLPWDNAAKAMLLLSLGLIYFLVPLVVVLRLCSRRQWLKMTGAETLMREVGKKQDS